MTKTKAQWPVPKWWTRLPLSVIPEEMERLYRCTRRVLYQGVKSGEVPAPRLRQRWSRDVVQRHFERHGPIAKA